MLGGIVRGPRVNLRTTTEEDLRDHVRWHADGELTKWMPFRPRPESLDQRKEWLKKTASDRRSIHWEIAQGDRHIGYCTVKFHDAPWSEAWEVTHLFLDPALRAQGCGSEAARIAHRYLITYLGLRFGHVWLYYDDAAARALFASLGYREVGHGRKAFYHSGRHWDEWFGLVRAEDFRARFPKEREYPDRPED